MFSFDIFSWKFLLIGNKFTSRIEERASADHLIKTVFRVRIIKHL